MKPVRLLAAAALVSPIGVGAQLPEISPFPAACASVAGASGAGLTGYVVATSGETSQCAALSGLLWSAEGSLVTQHRIAGLAVGTLGTLDLVATYDADPFVTFGATTTNLVAGPVTYAFLFGTPIVPGFYNTATAAGSVVVTTGPLGSGSVANSAIYPSFISGYGTLGPVATNLGVDLGTGTCSATTTLPAPASQTCTYAQVTSTFAPTFHDNLEALLTYTQSDVGSVAAWSGTVTLNYVPPTTVPEPGSIALVGTGLLALALGLRRRASGSASAGRRSTAPRVTKQMA